MLEVSAYLVPLAGMISFFRLSPLAAIARLRSRSFSNILIFSEKLSEASLFRIRSEEHTSELQSRGHLVCRLLLEKKKKNKNNPLSNKKKKQQQKHTKLN